MTFPLKIEGFGWLNELGSWINQQLTQAYHQYGVGSRPALYITKKSDKVYQLLAHGRWFSLCTPASATTLTGRHDIAEILLKVALNTKPLKIDTILVTFVKLRETVYYTGTRHLMF
jgi:tRNA(Ile)-lysidine synthase TilS/MesJ